MKVSESEVREWVSTFVILGGCWIFTLLLVLFTISVVILAQAMVTGQLLGCGLYCGG